MTMTTEISGPAGHLHIDDGGKGGIPVLFVHSFAGSSSHWVGELDHLRQSRRAVALDLRGHGQSDSPRSGSYGVDGLAKDVGAVANRLGLDKFVLVGHSLGGSAAVEYASGHSDRVAGLVLVGTPGQYPREQREQVMAALDSDYDKTMKGYWQKLLAGAQPGVAARIRSEMNSLSPEVSKRLIRAVFEYDPLPALESYAGPKLLVDTPHGESPGTLHYLLPEIPRRLISGTSHWPHLDRPEEFNRILDDFLAGVEVDK